MSNQPMSEEEFWSILHSIPESKPIFYRLYYNDDGTPICYSMEELPHNYIELDAETFHLSPPNVRVVDGQLKVLKTTGYIKKLKPSEYGITCDINDVSIIVPDSYPNKKWSLKNNETD